jgi:DNA-binding NarL/FixJ family response regulator
MIDIMIVDDHKLIRDAFKILVESNPDFNVVGDANNGFDCICKLKSCFPDIVMLDIDMPEMDGFETLRAIMLDRRRRRRPKVLMVSQFSDVDYVLRAFELKANGYLVKNSDAHELFRALYTVYKGGKFVQSKYIPIINSMNIAKNLDHERIELLTNRELQILKLIATGNTNLDVANVLDISERTVKNHLTNVYRKINCIDRTQATLFCIRNGLVSVQSY